MVNEADEAQYLMGRAMRAPWSPDSVAALLAHLQRLTDAVERVEAQQGELVAALKRNGVGWWTPPPRQDS